MAVVAYYLAGRLSPLCAARHMSLTGVARALGCHPSGPMNWDAGKRPVPVAWIPKLATLFRISAEELTADAPTIAGPGVTPCGWCGVLFLPEFRRRYCCPPHALQAKRARESALARPAPHVACPGCGGPMAPSSQRCAACVRAQRVAQREARRTCACGAPRSKGATRCHACTVDERRAETERRRKEATELQRRREESARGTPSTHQELRGKNSDLWTFPNKCQRCRKPIVFPGMCYGCGTGRPRLIVMPAERMRVAA